MSSSPPQYLKESYPLENTFSIWKWDVRLSQKTEKLSTRNLCTNICLHGRNLILFWVDSFFMLRFVLGRHNLVLTFVLGTHLLVQRFVLGRHSLVMTIPRIVTQKFFLFLLVLVLVKNKVGYRKSAFQVEWIRLKGSKFLVGCGRWVPTHYQVTPTPV